MKWIANNHFKQNDGEDNDDEIIIIIRETLHIILLPMIAKLATYHNSSKE